ncbi:MAG TPA: ribonuclease domain-containing protein [Gallionella sp.]|nr:ribonuclease domain-containing protein [Gallionella sp.]
MLRLKWIVLAAMLWLPAGAQAHTHHAAKVWTDMTTISAAQLPAQARTTLRAIKRGGPFAYQRDGVVFNNYEHALPERRRGYYHEYTVKTPGTHNRGTRRIISGATGEYFYTADHYQTFNRIRE